MNNSINENIATLHAALSDYIEATYHISNPGLVNQRSALLKTHGVIHQEAFLESTPRYVSGDRFSSIRELPEAVLNLFNTLSVGSAETGPLIYDPPYRHQLEAVEGVLVKMKNLMIMTGTGSGKTESFLLPILGKLVKEAYSAPQSFSSQAAVRALILYPMNALVNDQLGRVRNLFRDGRLKEIFRNYSGRIPTFARYTSRTPYPGIRDTKKDQAKLKSFEDFYIEIEQAATSDESHKKEAAIRLIGELKARGKWPAKPSLSKWYGGKGARWQDSLGNYQRAIALPEDSELITRQEVQAAPPDLLITNYSMLEYMLMRPIEQSIFEKTLTWLKDNPGEKFLIVIDEAHLYRGAAGAEVGLLLRRLRERLGIPAERFQVICATASFEDKVYALQFASQLTGADARDFLPITSSFNFKEAVNEQQADQGAKVLAATDLDAFYKATGNGRSGHIQPFLDYRGVTFEKDVEHSLYEALKDYGPLNKLINLTMGQAKALNELSIEIFNTDATTSEQALTVLLAFGSLAKKHADDAGLLPCRIHSFFRGLPGLWVCIDPDCAALETAHRSGVCGKLFSQPREHCDCGGRVFELYTCRNCGTAYARAYTDDLENPSSLWTDPGKNIRLTSSLIKELYPIDLLLEPPTTTGDSELSYLDIKTGRLNPSKLGTAHRLVYIRSERQQVSNAADEDYDTYEDTELKGKFTTCSVCNKSGGKRGSSVQDHQTKGEQPFLALLSRQIQIQPPNSSAPTRFSPLRGRKVLIFSDSRQMAAKLAPNLQTYSLRDALRPLLIWGFQTMAQNQYIAQDLCLDDSYLAVLLAANHFDLRLRPELKPADNFPSVDQQIRNELKKGILSDEMKFYHFFVKFRGQKAPESMLKEIINTLVDRFTGLEALALGTLCIKEESHNAIKALPDIPTIADNDEAKIALANYWVRCWQGAGYWLKDMPDSWWKPTEQSAGRGVTGHTSGKFKKVKELLHSKQFLKIFNEGWLPELLQLADDQNGTFRITGKKLTLDFTPNWVRCGTCSSVHKAIPGITKCLDCGETSTTALNPDTDPVFIARKGYYRHAVKGIFADPAILPLALIAAEHTAQLNASQSEDVFSKAEENELLFQDIDIEWPTGQGKNSAIDILSSTTTMEVGIDIGALSGVALRNMPPGRSNYQQRAGRAGRRGNAVATVIAFGSVDSHDEHFFSHPKEMISGPVVDPIITLNNTDIARRHVRAFLLQKYHQARLPEFLPEHHNANLFSVLGTVGDFLNGGILNRTDFQKWLAANEAYLKDRILSWIPVQFTESERIGIAAEAIPDCITAVDDAIDFNFKKTDTAPVVPAATTEDSSLPEPTDEESLGKVGLNDGLLDRLLYRGKLPRYAFPTDVATFYVFDRNKSTPFKTIMRFTPSQGLPIALSQYAPDRQVWISNKCYTSGAIYSPIRGELYEAWTKRRLYHECEKCGFAKTEPYDADRKRALATCDACAMPLGEPFNWLRPPGFAHPIDIPEETSPDGMPEVGYATRAKLYMPFANEAAWQPVNERISGLKVREHLLVSNTGPNREGYVYCVKCGRIEAKVNSTGQFSGEHPKPFPDEENPVCPGGRTSKIVLGTDFITDVALFSIDLSPRIKLEPGSYTYDVALRTLCEALSKAAAQMLEIEPNDIVAEYRPALTSNSMGRDGEQVEIFLYDTLAGGAGFSPQLVDKGKKLFENALTLIASCKEGCDTSCYRCLRTFRNKFEHRFLDRHTGITLAKYILTGEMPVLDVARIKKAMTLLYEDLSRNVTEDINYTFGIKGNEQADSGVISATQKNGKKLIIAIASPLTPTLPVNTEAFELLQHHKNNDTKVLPIDEFLIRNNLPSATNYILEKLDGF